MARKVEVFTADCLACEGVVQLVRQLADPSCDVTVYDLRVGGSAAARARSYGVTSVPTVVVDGRIVDCYARWLTGPLQALMDALPQVAAGDGAPEVPFRSCDEVKHFAQSLNTMLDGLQQRDFLRYMLQRYVDATVVEQIIEHPELIHLHGEKRELTVFFSDIEGFTSLAENRPPEQVVQLLNEYLEHLTDLIFEYQGTLDKYEGDKIMAFWGAPLPLENHALRACRAALAIQSRLGALRPEWHRAGKPPLPTRIGLNTGEMVVGNMGSSRHLDYTVVGDAVNLGARLESANRVYGTQILIGETTYQQVQGAMEVRELDRVRVYGKDQPLTIYQLLAEKGELAVEQQQLMHLFHQGLSCYHGRQWDVAERAFQQCLALDPEDSPSRVYLARCDHLRRFPPPDHWEGVHQLTNPMLDWGMQGPLEDAGETAATEGLS